MSLLYALVTAIAHGAEVMIYCLSKKYIQHLANKVVESAGVDLSCNDHHVDYPPDTPKNDRSH